ncbi:MAG: CrcB family protein [Pseudomonadota bacterium]
MPVTQQLVLVALGGAAGAACRHLVNLGFARSDYPWSTLIVNVVGSLLLGALVYCFAFRGGAWETSGRLLLATGFCGAFTTMSALALETRELAEAGSSWSASVFALGTLGLSIAGLIIGAGLARAVLD